MNSGHIYLCPDVTLRAGIEPAHIFEDVLIQENGKAVLLL